MGMKGTAYALTGSVGLLSDALESLVNLVAAVTAYVVLVYAARPPDPTHTFGHEKIEYFSSGLEGALIIVAGLGTIGYAVRRMIYPEPLANLELGTIIGLAASAVNFAVARILIHKGRQHESIVLEADGKHLMSDVWTSVGVLVGIGLVILTGFTLLDPLLAIAVGANIIWTGSHFVVRSFNGLMDHALPVEEQERIREIIRTRLPVRAEFHMLRTRQAGTRRFAEFHLLLEGDQSVRGAHHIAHEVSSALVEAIPGLEVMIHIEPIDEVSSFEEEAMKQLGESTDRVLPPLSPPHPGSTPADRK